MLSRNLVLWVCLLAAVLPLPSLAAQAGEDGGCQSVESMAQAEAGRRFMANHQFDSAAAAFQSALAACPQQVNNQLSLAEALSAEGKLDDAIRAANDFLRARPDSNEGRLVLANAHFRAQHFDDCRRIAEQILKSDPKSLPALQLKANSLYLQGEDPAATETLIGALVLYPNDENTAYMLGRMYYQQNRFDLAVGQFQRVLKLDPNSYKAYDNLGLCYEALNQQDLAIRYYMTAIKMVFKDHPDYEWPYANLADLMLKRGEDKKAFSLAAEAAKRNPHSARNFYLGGKALSKLDQTDLALKWLDQAARLDPNYPEPYYLLGQIYQRLGRTEEAKQALERFQAISKDKPRTRR